MEDSRKLAPARVNPVGSHPLDRRLTLDGSWGFRLDPEDDGLGLGWYRDCDALDRKVEVPGCWQGQGLGHDGKDEVWDFRIQTRAYRATYTGTGWYGRTFQPPPSWEGRHVWLDIGGVHPSADLWLNRSFLGSHSGPFVPFALDITDLISWKEDNLLVIRVHEKDRWMGMAFNWQGNWSGLYRSVELSATGDAWFRLVTCCADVDRQELRISAPLGGCAGGMHPVDLSVCVTAPDGAQAQSRMRLNADQAEVTVPVREPMLWSPDSPDLYRVDAVLSRGEEVLDAVSERAGFLKLSTRGKHFLINGQPYYMRGSGDFAANPETGSPDTDRERWRRKLRTLREYGYNYVRCQSYAPTTEYLDAADEVGMIVQSEMGMLGAWSGSSPWHVYAWPPPSAKHYAKLKWQWDSTVRRDVNHPSAAIYCMSNELGSSTLYPRTAWRCYHDTKAIKPWAMVIWTDGGWNPELPGDFVNAEAKVDSECPKPVIQHEFRWWSAYPDVRVKGKYSGAIRPYAIEMAEEMARLNGVEQLLPTMAQNSQRLQYIEARGKLEACRRDHPSLAGICHFNAMDIGFSPQGILDEFCEMKCVDASTWLRTWGDVVVLIDRDFDDRVIASGRRLSLSLFVSDFSHPPLKNPVLAWRLLRGRRVTARGELSYRHRPFRTCRIGRIQIDTPTASRPSKLVLQASIKEGSRAYRNEWDFHLMPNSHKPPTSFTTYGLRGRTWSSQLKGLTGLAAKSAGSRPCAVVVSDALDRALVEYMKEGGRLVLAAGEGLVRPFNPKLGLDKGRYFFLPPANYPPYEDGNSGTMLDHHPILDDLQHEGFADLSLYRPIADSPPIDLLPFGGWSVRPVIRSLNTYMVFHPLAYLAEFRVGKGGMIVSALDLDQRWPESRFLLSSILRHVSGRSFAPVNQLTDAQLERLIDLIR